MANWLAGLPGNNVTTFLEGALLMVRRTLFNQAPNVSPIQQTTTSEGLILGSLGAVDPDADPLTYSVVETPQWGAVEVTEDGDYLYTPGLDYAGSDSFTVNVATAQQGFNILTWGNGSRDVTVQVGSDAATNPFMSGVPDPIDASLYLADVTARIAVDRGGLLGNSFIGSVALAGITTGTQLMWMDATGRIGEISVGQMLAEPASGGTSWWDGFAEAGAYSNDGVMIGVDFIDDDGVETTVILSNVQASVDSGGQYVFTGQLAANPDEQPDIDLWDVLGSSFKDNYENFLQTYIQVAQFQPVTLEVTGADLFASTYSPVTYANILVGTDPGIAPEELGIGGPQSAAGIAFGSIETSPVTVMVPFANGDYFVGRDDGSVQWRTAAGWTNIKGTGWGSAVTAMLPYGDGLVVGLGNGSVRQWTGTGRPSPDATLNANVELRAGTPSQSSSLTSNNGSYMLTLQNDGNLVLYGGGDALWSANTAGKGATKLVLQGSDGNLVLYTDSGDPVWSTSTNTNKAVKLTVQDDGNVVLYDADGNSVWAAAQNGGVNGASGNYDAPLTPPVPAANNWTELHGDWGSRVDAMLAYGDGFVVGLNNGAVQQWTGTEWKELHSSQTLGSESWPQFDDNSFNATFTVKNGTSMPVFISDMPSAIQVDGSAVDYTAPTQSIQKGTVLAPGQTTQLSIRNGYFGSYYNQTAWATKEWNGSNASGAGDWGLLLKSSGSANAFNSRKATCTGSCEVNGDTITLTDGRSGGGSGQPYIERMFAYRDGFVVGLADGSVQQWTGSGWQQLQGTGWGSPIRSAMTFGDGFVAGLGNGSVQQWTGSEWRELQGQVWGSGVQEMLPFGDGFVAGLGNGSVQQWTGSEWRELQGLGWGSGVQEMLPFGDGFVVGLNNGSVQQWTGSAWNELKGLGWGSPVEGMVARPVGPEGYNRFVIGLADGSVQQWTGVSWTELIPKETDILSQEQLKAAVAFAENLNSGDLGSADTLYDAFTTNPAIWGQDDFLPACGSSCDGTFYPFLLKSDDPYELASKKWDVPGVGGQSVKLSYDVEHVVYGYAYVPGGVWSKLNLGKYAGGFLLALPTGPRLVVDLGGAECVNNDGTCKINLADSGEVELASVSKPWPSPYGVFKLGADVKARITADLIMPEGFDQSALTAYAYFVPGFLVAYNTKNYGGVQLGADWYLDYNFDDFTQIQGAQITPTLTPSVTGEYGLFTPEETPIIGQKTIASVTLGYSNPVSLTLKLQSGYDPSLTFSSSGVLNYGAGILQAFTDSLTFDDTIPIYSYTSDNLWPTIIV